MARSLMTASATKRSVWTLDASDMRSEETARHTLAAWRTATVRSVVNRVTG
jgi:hypothetical protein